MFTRRLKYQTILTTVVVFVFITKWGIYFFTHSLGVFSDALEGLVNVVAVFFGLLSIYISKRPKDKSHPYGHGKIEFVSGILEGVLLGLAGIFVVYHALYSFVHPRAVEHVDDATVYIFIISLLQGSVGYFLIHKSKRSHDFLLSASARHMLTDAFTSVVLSVGLCIIYLTAWWWMDAVLALLMSLWIFKNAYHIMREGMGGIMDEADRHLISGVVSSINQNRNLCWIDIHNLRIIRNGTIFHIDCHVTLPWYWSLEKSHDEVHKIEVLIRRKYGDQIELFAHIDPCLPICCSSCLVETCPHRQYVFKQKIEWTADMLLENKKHQAVVEVS